MPPPPPPSHYFDDESAAMAAAPEKRPDQKTHADVPRCTLKRGLNSAATGCAVGIMCILVCLGPVLIVLGGVVMSTSSNREENLALYNASIEEYTNSTLPVLAMTSASLDGSPMRSMSSELMAAGNVEDVPMATHITFRLLANLTTSGFSTQSLRIDLPGASSPSTVSLAIPATRMMVDVVTCEDVECAGAYLEAQCMAMHNGLFNGSDVCSEGDHCGVCTYTAYLASACVVVNISGTSATLSSKYRSCHYPFTDFEYTSRVGAPMSTVSAWISFVTADDPYLKLQELTQGTLDFGMTEDEQRRAGYPLVVVGLVMLLVACCLGCLAVYRFQKIGDGRQPGEAPYGCAVKITLCIGTICTAADAVDEMEDEKASISTRSP